MRILLPLTLVATISSPALCQDLQRPAGWNVRFDQAGATEADLEMFVEMPPGWHVTSGPAGIYWHPDTKAAGDYRVEMDVFLFDPGPMREGFGLFVGGSDLNGEAQAYTYFLIRNGGQFIIKTRSGRSAPTVQPWTANEAVRSYSDRGNEASVKNTLALEVRADRVRFLVNEAEVSNLARGDLPLEGIVGFRVNHRLNLHVSRLEVIPLG